MYERARSPPFASPTIPGNDKRFQSIESVNFRHNLHMLWGCPHGADILEEQCFPSKAKSISCLNWLDSWWDSWVALALQSREHDGHSGANSVPVKWLNALSSLPQLSERPVHIQGVISRLVCVIVCFFAGDPSCQSSTSTYQTMHISITPLSQDRNDE